MVRFKRPCGPNRLVRLLGTIMLCAAVGVAGAAPEAAPSRESVARDAATKARKEVPVESRLTVEAAPRWVDTVPVDPSAPVARAAMHLALDDHQTRVDRDGVTRYVHRVRVINDSGGLTGASQIRIDFDPLYQRLALHDMSLWRDGRRINKLDRKQVTLLHRETQLEAQVYDGRVTATRVLDDLRVGDRIEWSYSLRGANPVFGERFVDVDWTAASSGPVAVYRYRLLAPEARAIHLKTTGSDYTVDSAVRGGLRETIVWRRNIAQIENDATVPASAYLTEQVNWSEFADWGEVARWAQELFARAQEPSPDLAAQAEAIRAQAGAPAEQLRMALDFVQTQVRYFGTELGEYSHRPAPPAKVLAQRFGDCKDKTTLLVALLHQLGIEARPALVSTYFLESVGDMQPSPLAFNHVIARVELDGRTYWLDGTRAYQTGTIDSRGSTGLGKALLARDDGAPALVDVPAADTELRVDSTDTLHVGSFTEPPTLEVRIGYHGELAEMVRSALANRPVAEVEKGVLGDYLRSFPSARKLADMQVQEDPTRNALNLGLRFALPDYWQFPEQQRLVGNFAMVSTMTALRVANQAPRTRPLAMPYPGLYRETFSFDFPEDVTGKASSNDYDERNRFFTYHAHLEGSQRSNRITGELRIPLDRIEAADWPDYLAGITKVWPHLSGSVSVPAVELARIDALKAASQALLEDLKSGRVKVTTSTQARARMGRLVADAQLVSNRLAPKLRAQALVRRAEQSDHLGDYESAHADLEAAAQLDPSYPEVHAALAVNALSARRDDEVAPEVARALELAPGDTLPRYTRLFSNYLRGLYQKTQEEANELLENPAEVERSYAALWLYLATRRLGGDGRKAIDGHLASGPDPGWPYPVVQLLTGRIDMDQATKAATDDDRPSPEKRCELFYYAAEQAVLDGDLRKARKLYGASIDTGVVEFNEYIFARRGLDRLDARP